MRTISGFLLSTILGWQIKGEFPDANKSIIIFAPHTSYFDALYGKLYFNSTGIKHRFLSKKELFYFPLNIFMKWYGSIPVRGVAGKNAIFEVANMLESAEKLHIVLSPEGAFAKVTRWDKGFYYMAFKAKVPIVVGYLDYEKKEIGVKGVIENLENTDAVMLQISNLYKGVQAKHPENFSTHIQPHG
jgi:1-acyl-sn-glycerol-3-phosphate acyltransferase